MKNKQRKDQIPFTQIPNALICDKNISAGAKAVYSYMQSKPDNWNFYNNDIKKSLDIGANKTLARYFKELITNGWISRSRKQINGKMSGGYDYTVHFENILTKTEKLHIRQNSTFDKRYNHSNKESFNNKEKNNNKEKESSAKSKIFLTSFQKDIFNKFWFYLETKHPHSYKQYQKKKNRMETNWGETINWLLDNTKDTYSESEIYNAIKNATIDNFWSKQFRSINKLKQTDKEGTRYIAKFLDLGEQNKSEVDRYLEGV